LLVRSCTNLIQYYTQAASPNPLDVYADITISGEPSTPLIQLATHILSICPNSASCERLFSTFGLILTKLRTRLNNQHVVNLAECKMHIRDEHLEKEVKRRLRKRLFGALAENAATQLGVSNSATGAVTLGTTEACAMLLTPVSQDSDTLSTQEIVPGPPPAPRSTESLHTLTERHIAMLNSEEVVCGSTAAGANMTDSTTMEKRKIVDCFNFSSDT
jgi:hypothetical protein